MPILSVLLIGAYALGARALQDFGLALLIGLLTGAYSSIFIASPLLAILKEREPRYSTIRQRVASKGGVGAPLTPAAAAVLAGGGSLPSGGGPPLRPGMGRTDVADEVDTGGRPEPSRPSNQARGKASSPRPGGNRPAPRPRKKKRR
jgi:preprotein translocase subunit SecF